MSDYIKITKSQAELIGKFEYEPNKAFDPFVCEQKDGTYLVETTLYNTLKLRPQILKVDFDTCPKIATQNLDTIKEPRPTLK